MNIDEEARKAVTQSRQHVEHLESTVRHRAEESVETPPDEFIESEARNLTTQQRQHDDHIEETMLERAVESVEVSESST
ncbi:MAG: hypothetical protein AAFY78_09090 [Cyanobacteria bacterium J06648_16]